MNDADRLQQGVALGIITEDQKRALEQIGAESPGDGPQDGAAGHLKQPILRDEAFRLVGGANDVLVGLGIVLFLVGAASALMAWFDAATVWPYLLLCLCCLAIAEFITRRRHMKFSSLVLAVGFAGSLLASTTLVLVNRALDLQVDNIFQALALRSDIRMAGWGVAAFFCIIAALHLWRYRVPVMAAVIALSLAALAGLIMADFLLGQVLAVKIQIGNAEQMQMLARQLLYFALAVGLVIFTAGIAMDVHDRHRDSLWSDCAFWMHVVSAPLMVHPLFVLATGQDLLSGTNPVEGGSTGLVLLFIVLFLYLALIIDRRSLLVPSLTYFGTIGIASLVDATSQTTGLSPVAIILLVLGSLIVLFGTGWHAIRGLVVRTTLPHVVASRLPVIQS